MNADTNNNAVQAAGIAVQDFTTCPHWGQGGQYVVDPATGLRTRLGEPPAAPGAPTVIDIPVADVLTERADADPLATTGAAPAVVDQVVVADAVEALQPASTDTEAAAIAEAVTTTRREKARG